MPESSRSEFFICGASDIGKRRSRNEDHFLVASLRRQLIVEQTDVSQTLQHQLFGCHEGKLLMVADGMGGHQGGELASRTAIETSARYVLDMMHWFLKLSQDDSGGSYVKEAVVAQWRHVLWNCVGGDRQVRPEAVRCRLQSGDVILLCSDGLTGMIDDWEISAILSSSETSKIASTRLIDAANSAGGDDNISVVVSRIGKHVGCEDTVVA